MKNIGGCTVGLLPYGTLEYVFECLNKHKMSETLLNLIRPEIRRLKAYHVPNASGLIKLDAMENPYRLPAELLASWQAGLDTIDFNRYPDPAAASLREQLQQIMQVPEGMATMLGNGSDELIQMLAMAVSGEGRSILSLEPGFVMYRMIAEFVGMSYVGVPLATDFSLDMDAVRAAIETHQPAILFIAYPNNPTGNLFSEAEIEAIIQLAPGFVVLDEAYHPFAQKTFMPKLTQYENLLVMRTVSKMGLAGLRLGMLCGHPGLIQEIDKLRLPYNINVLTQYTARFVLEDSGVLDEQAAMIRSEREKLFEAMTQLNDIDVFPTQANFILFRTNTVDANKVFEFIRERGVLIKNMNATQGMLKNCLRVTVGTPEENAMFMQALQAALAG